MPLNVVRIQENVAGLSSVLAAVAFILLARYKQTVDQHTPQDAFFYSGISLVFLGALLAFALALSLQSGHRRQASGWQRQDSSHHTHQSEQD